jgi:hypothetical protein
MSVFEPALLPLHIKEQLSLDLLAEFGAISIRVRSSRQEIIHGCLVGANHTDQARNPTASFNYEKLTYKCLGCQAKGGILWLICRVRGCTSQEAREWLAKETGTGGNVMSLKALLEYYDAIYTYKPGSLPPIPTFDPVVLEPWLDIVHPWLTTGVEDLDITGRGIPEQNVRDLRIGWNSQTNEIVIPHFWKGELVGWQKRALSYGTSKYESTGDFPKEQTLYDYDAKRGKAILCESPLSVAKHRHALPFEATFGADVTDRQIRLMASHYEKCVLWMDNDLAGWRALEGTKDSPGIIDRLSPYCPVWIVPSPFWGGPDDVETVVAEHLVEMAVPAAAWQRPRGVLYCPKCHHEHSKGRCSPDA